MDATTAMNQGKEFEKEFETLAKKYKMTVYGFYGFLGQPGSGHFPVCVYNVIDLRLANHPHIAVCKAAFLSGVDVLRTVSGDHGIWEVTNKLES